MRNPSRAFIKNLEQMACNPHLTALQRLKAAELLRDFILGKSKVNKVAEQNEKNLKKLLGEK